jgi:hypothetical protein
MVTIVTHIPLKDGADRQWDTVMHERMASAKGQPGWVGGAGAAVSERQGRRRYLAEPGRLGGLASDGGLRGDSPQADGSRRRAY